MNPETTTDHDLLIELRSDVKALRAEVKDINDNTKTTLFDHENRLRFIERYMWAGLGILGFVQVIIGWYLLSHR